MKLKDAIFEMKPGDKFVVQELEIVSPFLMTYKGYLKNSQGDNLTLCRENLSLEGEIIKAKPVVLSAEEYEKQYYAQGRSLKEMIKKVFSDGRKHGRLERDLELRPVFDWVRARNIDTLNRIIENLPPLEND